MITVEHLTKYYGEFKAVDDLSFTIGEGHVYGFLGPNGAGKSTTMNIIAGCLSATEGTVRIGGHDIYEEPNEAKKLIGYLPERPPLYLNENPVEYLSFVGQAKGLRGDALRQQIQEVMDLTGVSPMKNRRISALSKGYQQRLGIAQALLGDPKVIILDEPTVGLDPIQIIEIRELIRKLGEAHTVIFSSHILSEVQAICDEILIIAHGKLLAFDDPQTLERRLLTPDEILLTTDAPEEALADILSGVEQISQQTVEQGEGTWTVVHIKTDCSDIYELSRSLFLAFAGSPYVILEMRLKRGTLEDVFLELTEAEPEAAPAAPAAEPGEEADAS